MQQATIATEDLTGIKDRLITMSISKTTGLLLDETDNADSFKATIARLNRESKMYFTQKTINGKLFIRRVA
jgi:hypothetical protein